MFKKILLVFIIISFLVTVGSGESEEEYEFTEFHNYSPAYTIIPMPNEIIVNRGDSAEIKLYVSGLGKMEENKVLLRFPDGLLADDQGEIYGSIVCVGDNITNFHPLFKIEQSDLTSMRIVFNKCNFISVIEKESTPRLKKAPILLSERDNTGYPPIGIKLNISDKATIGDQYIYLVFTYTDGTKWYQDKEKIKIHVNSVYERYYVSHLIVVGVLVALFGQLIMGLYGRSDKNLNAKKKNESH